MRPGGTTEGRKAWRGGAARRASLRPYRGGRQVAISRSKTRPSSLAQCQYGVPGCVSSPSIPCWHGVGMLAARSLLCGATQPPERTRGARGTDTNATRFSSSANGDSVMPVVPSDYGLVHRYRSSPFASCSSRASDTTPRAVYRIKRPPSFPQPVVPRPSHRGTPAPQPSALLRRRARRPQNHATPCCAPLLRAPERARRLPPSPYSREAWRKGRVSFRLWCRCCQGLVHMFSSMALGALSQGLEESGGYLSRWGVSPPTPFSPCGRNRPSPDPRCVV